MWGGANCGLAQFLVGSVPMKEAGISEKVIEDKLCRLQNVESSMHLHNYVGAPPMMRGVWSMAVLPWQHAECHFY